MCSQNIHIHTKKVKLFLKKTLGDGIGIVADTYNSSTEETDGELLCIRGQPRLRSEFQTSPGYRMIPISNQQQQQNKYLKNL